jgi:glycosyltransferase involved in cell wall biosynthesis
MNSPATPLVSIGIPTYNRAERNLRKVIERALGQSYKHVEVIVSDNCSSDHTPELVGTFDDQRLRYIRQERNIGPNNNFNFCLQQARGEYFLLFHDDDMIDEDFVESCIASLTPGEPVGAIFTGVRIIDEHDHVLREYHNRAAGLSAAEFILGWFDGKVSLYLCSTLYNTEKLKAAGGFHSAKGLFDDLVPTFTLVAREGRSDVAAVKASFRRHSGSGGSAVPVSSWIEDSHYLLETIYTLFPQERELFEKRGTRYFCRKMYWYASARADLRQRLRDYVRIYKSFGYSYSPVAYLLDRTRGRLATGARRLFGR